MKWGAGVGGEEKAGAAGGWPGSDGAPGGAGAFLPPLCAAGGGPVTGRRWQPTSGSGSYTQSEPESEKGGPVLRGATWLQFRERTGWGLGVRSLRRGGAGRAEAGTEGLL